MPSGVYERTPEHGAAISKALTGVKLPPRTPEHCEAISKVHTDVPLSPEHRAAISKAKTGVPRTPEARAAISKGQKGIPHTSAAQLAADKTNGDRQRGGNDLVNHHYIYDHNDLSLNTVQMTRSDHQKLHKLLQKLKYIVPHITINMAKR